MELTNIQPASRPCLVAPIFFDVVGGVRLQAASATAMGSHSWSPPIT